MDQQAEKDRKSNRTRQKNKRGDSKVESNDSPQIPDRGETSGIPGFPSGGGGGRGKFWQQKAQIWLTNSQTDRKRNK